MNAQIAYNVVSSLGLTKKQTLELILLLKGEKPKKRYKASVINLKWAKTNFKRRLT